MSPGCAHGEKHSRRWLDSEFGRDMTSKCDSQAEHQLQHTQNRVCRLKNLRNQKYWQRDLVYGASIVTFALHRPHGLRYQGMGDHQTLFPHDTGHHPALRVIGKLSKEERYTFIESKKED
ncbi:hypothetical protein G6O67_006875 [Ophiocordyceps sinensis]|uniref:Uncharacterized protein n=1 Tax=Ophiocordyceps sinensis TaxID=72228 RepID=A0A8H4LWJ0_9HYPO|nr:hypothetical protein G6O67_006875 [Ophiocordyceps sinensis]